MAWRLPGDALIEFVVRRQLDLWVEWALPGIRISHSGGPPAWAMMGAPIG